LFFKFCQVAHRLALTVRVRSSAKLLEFHDVLGECACLIREHEVDSAQLLIEVGRLGLGRHVLLHVIHLPVVLDHCSLDKFDCFQGDHH
jgi:hypothetical protein